MESLRLLLFSFFFLPPFFHLSFSVTTVAVQAPSPSPSPSSSAPPPTLGGIVPSAPAFPWPFRPRPRESVSPSPALLPPASPYLLPEKGDGPVPFIFSNPVLPLPTGEVDSATIRPFQASHAHAHAHGGISGRKIVHVSLVYALCWMLL